MNGKRKRNLPLTSLVELNVLPPDFVLPRLNNFSANDVARENVLEAFFGETEGNDNVLPVARPNSSVVTADEVSSAEETSEDVEWLVRIEPPPAREILPNLRKLVNFGDFIGWVVELPPSTVDCLAGILGKVVDSAAKELVVD